MVLKNHQNQIEKKKSPILVVEPEYTVIESEQKLDILFF